MQRYTISGFTIPQVTILAGALMATLGLSFYGFTDYLTALFPTLFGVILMIAGAVSVSRPGLNALSYAPRGTGFFDFSDTRIYNGLVWYLDNHYITD